MGYRVLHSAFGDSLSVLRCVVLRRALILSAEDGLIHPEGRRVSRVFVILL